MHGGLRFLLLVPLALLALGAVLLLVPAHPSSAPAPRSGDPARRSKLDLEAAEQSVARAPKDPDAWCQLARIWMQRARETGDFGANAGADSAVARALALDPAHAAARELEASLHLVHHRFPEARDAARRLLQETPGAPGPLGILVDAQVELGDYPAAVEHLQRMVDARPDVASYARVSYLRALHGDPEGAIEAMRMAVEAAATEPAESEAWCRVHLALELLTNGRKEEAEREIDRALELVPGYHHALAARGWARLKAGDLEGAAAAWRLAQDRVPQLETAILLGDLYTRLGRTAEAARQYQLVEVIAKAGSGGDALWKRQLALFWADHDQRIDEALAAARAERALRADIYTCDALAWCLFKAGHLAEARDTIREALRLGTRDARIHYHAGMIYNALGDTAEATRHLGLALQIDPAFDPLQAGHAREALDRLTTGTARTP